MQWPEADERAAAAICYTSGTTGRPKGVVYSHRSLVLHSLVGALPDVKDISSRDTLLPVVPMFHANAWGMIYTATMIGSGLVLPGPKLDAENVLELLADERVTVTAGVPTVWMAILHAVDAEPDRWDLSSLRQLVVGGSAVPKSMLEGFDRHGLTVIHAWGMTETSPLGSVCRLPIDLDDASEEERYDYRGRQGTATPFVEIRARNDEGELIPWDDEAMGELEVRGPWVARAYHRGQGEEKFTDDGWFQTGDVVKINARLQSADLRPLEGSGQVGRRVDLLGRSRESADGPPRRRRSGGDRDPRRALGREAPGRVVLNEGQDADPDELREHLATDFAKWQLPERFEFIEEIPRTATGKFKKTELREQFVETVASQATS